jgi:hypothetical protein
VYAGLEAVICRRVLGLESVERRLKMRALEGGIHQQRAVQTG